MLMPIAAAARRAHADATLLRLLYGTATRFATPRRAAIFRLMPPDERQSWSLLMLACAARCYLRADDY